MATPQALAAAARMQRALERMRANRAAMALGNDIPRPNPSAAAVPEIRQAARGYDDVAPARPMPPAEVPPLPAVPPDSVAALVRKVSQEGVDSLTPDEAILFDDIVAGRVRVSEVDATTAAREVLEEAAPVDGDLPAAVGSSEQVDNLESSAIDLDTPTQQGNPNLRVGRKKKQSPAEIAANEVQQLTTASGEAVSPRQIKRTLAKVNNFGRDSVVAALGPDGERRLARLEEMASDAARDPNAAAAASIATAADARAAAGAPRGPRQSAMAGMEPNAFGSTPGLPGLIERFNALPDAVRAGVVRRLQSNPNAASLFEAGGGVDSISPNRFAELLRPVNEVDELLQQADQFRAVGDNAAADAALELAREASREVRTPALASFTRRKAVEAALSEALPAADPSPQVMASPGQPAMLRPGDRTPEFATDEAVPLPTQADDALASLRERLIERENRAPGGGTTQEQRMEAVGAESVRELPLGLRGEANRIETRSRGDRGIETNDVRRIQRELRREELLAEYRTYSAAAADARATGDTAALEAAQAQLKRIAEEVKPLGRPPAEPYAAMPDSRLNKPGQQETLDELGVTAAGFRPRAESNLNRSSDSLSAADRAALQDEAVRAFGETDASELMPEPGELDDVSVLGEGGKRGRLGGGLSNSRWMGAIDQLYKGVNPLLLDIFGGDPLRVAEDFLTRQRIFKPGTANYDMAKEQLAKEIALRYSGQRIDGATDAVPQSSRPIELPDLPDDWKPDDLELDVGLDSLPAQNLESSAIELGTDLPPAGATPARTAAAAGGDLPAATGSDSVTPAPATERAGRKVRSVKELLEEARRSKPDDVPPATGRQFTDEEISDQADAAYQEAYWAAQEEGASPADARDAGAKARAKTLRDLQAAQGSAPGKATPQTAAGGGGGKQPPKDPPNTPKDKPASDPSNPADAAGRDGYDDLEPADGGRPKDAGDAAKPDAPKKKPGSDADGTPKKDGPIRRLLKDWRTWAAGAGLVGAGVAWDYLDDSENAPIDIPGGGGAGGGDGQGSGRDINLPVPPGGVPREPEPLTQEQKVRATLDRIRAQRAAGIGSRGTQTLQNF